MQRFLALSVALFCVSLSAVRAEERILDFQSRITVHEDSTLTVRETIRVVCEGQNIKRGIYRDFPTDYLNRQGLRIRVGFQVREVLKDGQPEPYHQERQSNGVRVYIGKSDVSLSPGEYTYTLLYETDSQIGFFPDHDELYWNVTGNDWTFPILRASAAVELPPGAAEGISEVDAYTGPERAQGKDFTSRRNPDGTVEFASTRTLDPEEGLTILVSWGKGIIREPTRAEKTRAMIKSNTGPAIGLLAILLLVVYYLAVWIAVGRDPAAGTIIPLYSPPENLSPAAVRFIRQMGFDNQAMAAAVIDMAVKGHLEIKEKKGSWTLNRIEGSQIPLSPDEQAVDKALLGSGGTTELERSNYRTIQSALQAIQSSLRLSYEKVYFVTNAGYFAGGLLASIAILVLNLVLQSSRTESIFLGVWLSFWTLGVVFLLKQAVLAWKALFSERAGHSPGRPAPSSGPSSPSPSSPPRSSWERSSSSRDRRSCSSPFWPWPSSTGPFTSFSRLRHWRDGKSWTGSKASAFSSPSRRGTGSISPSLRRKPRNSSRSFFPTRSPLTSSRNGPRSSRTSSPGRAREERPLIIPPGMRGLPGQPPRPRHSPRHWGPRFPGRSPLPRPLPAPLPEAAAAVRRVEGAAGAAAEAGDQASIASTARFALTRISSGTVTANWRSSRDQRTFSSVILFMFGQTARSTAG
jgi:hypothetical protein